MPAHVLYSRPHHICSHLHLYKSLRLLTDGSLFQETLQNLPQPWKFLFSPYLIIFCWVLHYFIYLHCQYNHFDIFFKKNAIIISIKCIIINFHFILLYLPLFLLYLLWKKKTWWNITQIYSLNIHKIHYFWNYKKSWLNFWIVWNWMIKISFWRFREEQIVWL